MILNRPLTTEDCKSSQKSLYIFNIINGFSYMCLGETLIILLAVKILMPDTLIAALGAMQFIGYLLLPLGVMRTAKVGAAQCQADFWIVRNVAALLTVAAAFIATKFTGIGWGIFLFAAFIFYGCRAAGVVMWQPLLGQITNDEDRGQFISRCCGAFYLFGVISLIIVSMIVQFNDSLYVLCGVVTLGATLGMTAARFIRGVRETDEVLQSAKKKLLPQFKDCLKNSDITNQLFAVFWLTVAVVTILPISVLVIKKGYGFTDTQSLFFSAVQFIACFSISFLTAKFAAKKGPRLQLLFGYVGFFVVILLWLLVPFTNLWMIIPISIVAFFLNGYSFIMANNALQTYFLMTVPKTQQVVTAILVNVLGSCCAGLVGMLIAGSLLKLSPILEPQVFLLVQRYFPSVMKQTLIYKIYFAMLLPILFIGLYWICKIRNINASLKENLCEEKLKETIISKDND